MTFPISTASRSVGLGVDPGAAYRRAVTLQRAGLHVESVPLFRHAMLARPEIGQLHLEYGEALYNAATETDQRFGFVRFVVPSSQERAALVKEAILELRRAVEMERTAEQRAYALFVLGRTLSLVGMPSDALESTMKARSLAPHVRVLRDLESSQRAVLTDTQR